jgi:hypothetical protein
MVALAVREGPDLGLYGFGIIAPGARATHTWSWTWSGCLRRIRRSTRPHRTLGRRRATLAADGALGEGASVLQPGDLS